MSVLDELPVEQADLVRDIMGAHGYSSLTETQEQAFRDGILTGGNHLLVAETGNGKTLCAEAITKQTLDSGGRVAYLVPSRSLVSDKADEIGEWATEDHEVTQGGAYEGSYSHGDVIVATFDSFYQAILRDVGDVRALDCVVLDDFHEIYGSFRGPGIEKSIGAILDNNIRIFAMSATLGNPVELAEWMDANPIVSDEGRRIEIVEKPVQYTDDDKKIDVITGHISEKEEKSPFLVFNSSKKTAESRASQIADDGLFDDVSERSFKTELVDDVISEGEVTDELRELAAMMENGVAYHHASLPRDIRDWIEGAIHDRDISCIFCTTTIAYGFDAPIQSVVVADLKRYNGRFMEYVGVWEYIQWIGRAARPGKGFDPGYAFPFYKDPDGAFEFFGDRELEDVESHIRDDDTFRRFLLEMIEMGWDTKEEIEAFFQQTLYWEQISGEGAWGRDKTSKIDQLRDSLRRHVDWLESNNFITEQVQGRFETTSFGSAAVKFLFETFKDATLDQIYSIHQWLSNKDLYPIDFVHKLCSTFYIDVSKGGARPPLRNTMDKLGLPHNDAGTTTALIAGYWMRNWDLEAIGEETGIEATYLPRAASDVASYMESAEHLIDSITDLQKPTWYDNFIVRLDKGVRNQELMAVKEVDQLGRSTARAVYSDLKSLQIFNGSDTGTILEMVSALDETSDEQQTKDVLKKSYGIGQARSERLYEAAMSLSERKLEKMKETMASDTVDTGRPSSGNQGGEDNGPGGLENATSQTGLGQF